MDPAPLSAGDVGPGNDTRVVTRLRFRWNRVRRAVPLTAATVAVLLLPASSQAEELEAVWYRQAGTVGACGRVLGSGPAGTYHYVAHPSWACGTRLTLRYRGRQTWARVWDRGPYGGADIDLARRVFRKLAPASAGRIHVDVVRRSR